MWKLRQELVESIVEGPQERYHLNWPGKREALWGDGAFDVTTSEFDLLESLMRAGELVSSKEELSLRVLGRPRESYDRSIDVHVSNLRRKLAGCSDGAVEIETIRGIGYRLKVPS